jgi:tRNA dimethylallyltransferase
MVSSHLIPLIIAGVTASGKSKAAIELAEGHDGEIICADSRQFYAFMRIGTASPSDEDLKRVPHHGFNIINPAEKKLNAGFFVDFARKTILDCQKRGKRPILVGGTGLYLRALRYGLFDVPPSDKNLVSHLEKRADQDGLALLYNELIAIDEALASSIRPEDRYRIIRALEIFHQTKVAPSKLRQSFLNKNSTLNAHWAIKSVEKSTYDARLKERVNAMIDAGLIDEAISLRERLSPDSWALTVMGYEEALRYVDGLLSKDEMLARIFIRHRQYAKRQRNWFKRETFYRWHI